MNGQTYGMERLSKMLADSKAGKTTPSPTQKIQSFDKESLRQSLDGIRYESVVNGGAQAKAGELQTIWNDVKTYGDNLTAEQQKRQGQYWASADFGTYADGRQKEANVLYSKVQSQVDYWTRNEKLANENSQTGTAGTDMLNMAKGLLEYLTGAKTYLNSANEYWKMFDNEDAWKNRNKVSAPVSAPLVLGAGAQPAKPSYAESELGVQAYAKALEQGQKELEYLYAKALVMPSEENIVAYENKHGQMQQYMQNYNAMVERYGYFQTSAGIEERIKQNEAEMAALAATDGEGLGYGWYEEYLKRIEALKQENQDLASLYYMAENQEQLDKVLNNEGLTGKYTHIEAVEQDINIVAEIMAAGVPGANVDQAQIQKWKDYLFAKYGLTEDAINAYYIGGVGAGTGRNTNGYSNISELYNELIEKSKVLKKDFAGEGFDYARMSGYEKMLKDKEAYEQKQAEWEEYAKKNPVGASLNTILHAPFMGLDYLSTVIHGAGAAKPSDYKNYVPANVYSMNTTNFVETVRGTVSKSIEEKTDWELFGSNVASFLYNTGMSMADSTTQIALWSLMGAPQVAGVVLGMNAASSSAKGIIERGGTSQQAILGGFASGVAEMIFENIGIDNLLKMKAPLTLKTAAKNVLKQGAVEAGEEVCTEIANIFSDAAIMANKSEFSLAVQKYMNELGLSEKDAKEKAYLDCVNRVVLSAAGGFISGFSLGGLKSTFDYVANGRSTVGELKEMGYGTSGIRMIEDLVNSDKGVNLPQALQLTAIPYSLGRMNVDVSETLLEDELSRNAYKAGVKDQQSGNKNTATDVTAGERYSIETLDDGRQYVQSSRQVIMGTTRSEIRRDVTNFFNELLDENGRLEIETVDGEVLTLTKKETADKARYDKNPRNNRTMSASEFALKARIEAHIDEVAQVSQRKGDRVPAKHEHDFSKDGFTFRTAYFRDFDGQFYEVTLSVGHNGETATVYNVSKKKSAPQTVADATGGGSVASGGTLSNNSISDTEENSNQNFEEDNGNGENRTAQGGREDATAEGAGADVLSRNGRGTVGESAGEQAGSDSAGGRNRAQAEQSRRIAERGNRKTADGNVKCSAKELFASGTDEVDLTRFAEENYDDEMLDVDAWVYKMTGIHPVFVLGTIHAYGADGNICNARGVYDGNNIVLQANHTKYSLTQLARHEVFHHIDAMTPELRAKIRAWVESLPGGEETLKKIVDTYVANLDGLYVADIESNPSKLKEATEYAIKELFADAYAGINAFGANAISLQSGVETLVAENYRMPTGETAAATERTTGPPAEVRYSFVGRTAEGYGIYKTNYPDNTPKAQKQADLVSLIQDVWSHAPIDLTIVEDGQYVEITAMFNPDLQEHSDLAKIAFGNRKGTGSEKRMTLDLSSDLYQIATEAKFNYSKDAMPKPNNPAHDGVTKYHYFLTNLVYKGNDGSYIPCHMNIDVKHTAEGDWFYSFAIEKGSVPQTLLAAGTENSATLPNNSISDTEENSNQNFEEENGNGENRTAQGGREDATAQGGREDATAEGAGRALPGGERGRNASETQRERVGTDGQRADAYTEQSRTASQRRAVAAADGNLKAKSKDYLRYGTENESLTVLAEENWDAELQEAAERLMWQTGIRPVFVLGAIEVRVGDKVRSVNGAYTGHSIIIRADSNQYTATQLAMHEEFHHISSETLGLRAKIREYLERDPANRERLDKMLAKHAEKALEIYAREDARSEELTPEELDKIADRAMEELLANAYAGMGVFGADTFQSAVQMLVEENYTVPTGETAAATERTTGPPDGDLFAYDGENKAKKNPRNLTVEETVVLIERANHGYYSLKSYVPVRSKTPRLLINAAEAMGLPTVNDLPFISNVEHLQQTMDVEVAANDGKRGHALTATQIAQIINNLDNPSKIFFQEDNERYAVIVLFDNDGRREKAMVIIDTKDVKKNPSVLNGYEGGAYNILVTTFPPTSDYYKKYVVNKNNILVYDKNEGVLQRGSGGLAPSHLNNTPYTNIISDSSENSKGHFDENGNWVLPKVEQEELWSADPVTYDDSGNAIPLSERFGVTDKYDVRYSYDGEADVDAENTADTNTKPASEVEALEQEIERRYDYDTLISKPDMPLTVVDDTVQYAVDSLTRKDIVRQSKKNAAAIGRTNENGVVEIYVGDIGTNVALSTEGLKHGLDRRMQLLAPVTLKSGEILSNAIRINELIPRKETISTTYALLGAARGKRGELYIVEFVVNRYDNTVASMDVLYSVNTKKESAALNAPRLTAKPLSVTDSTISIAQLLELARDNFPDVLPESVLRHFGYDARPEGTLGESALFSYDGKVVTTDADTRPATEREALEQEIERLTSSNYLHDLLREGGWDALIENQEKVKKLQQRLERIRAKETKEVQKPKERAQKQRTAPIAESKPVLAAKDLRKKMLDLFEIPDGKKAEMGSLIDVFGQRLLQKGVLTEDDRKALIHRLYSEGVMEVAATEYKHYARNEIIGRKIYVNDSIREEFGEDWDDFRRRAFGVGVMLVSDRTAPDVDVWNQNFAEILPDLFDTKEYDGRTVLENIVRVAEDGKSENMSLADYMRMLADDQAVTVDEQLAELEKRVEDILEDFAEQANLEIKLRDRTGIQIALERKRNREAMELSRQNRELREMQQKTLKQLQWLNRNRNRAPEDLRATWDSVLSDMDIYAVGAANEMRWSERHRATWRDLAEMYKQAKENDPNFLPSKELEKIVARLDNKKIADLDVSALQDLYRAAVGLRTEFYNRNNVINDLEHRLFAEVFDESKADLEKATGKYTGKGVDKFFNLQQLTPMNVLQRMVGWKKDGAWMSMARQLEQGERDMHGYVYGANRFIENFLKEHERWVRKADGQGKDAIWYEVKIPELVALELGKEPDFGAIHTVYMTPAQKIQLYLESKSFDNLRHMEGGRTFVDKELYSKGKRQEAFAQGKTIRLAPETVKAIVADLTDVELELAMLLEQYYNSFAKDKINAVSNVLYGYDKAMSGYYAPIFTNQNYVKSEIGTFDVTAEGVGHMKARQYAVNPSYNIGAFDAFERHVDQTSRFVGMAIPARNWNTLLSWRVKNNSTGDVITHKWGEEGKQYIEKLLETLQAGEYQESTVVDKAINKLYSNYIAAVFGVNPSIVLKQLGSIPLASAYLDLKNVPNFAQLKSIDRELIAKYTPELGYRTMGYSMLETETLKDNPNWTQSNKTFRFIFGGGAITTMDGMASSMLWPWAENKVRREFPDLEVGTREQIDAGQSPFYKKVAELYNEALTRSQSVADEMHQSVLRKSKGTLSRAFTMFKSDAAQGYNVLRQKIGETQYLKENGGSKEEIAAASKKVGSAFMAIVTGYLYAQGITFLINLWKHKGKKYRDDEDELTAESVIKEMVRGLAGDMAGVVIGGEELVEIIGNLLTDEKWYGIDTPGMEQLVNMVEESTKALREGGSLVKGAVNVLQHDGDVGEYFRRHGADLVGEIKNIATTLAMNLGGIPLENMEAYLLGLLKWVAPSVATAYEDAFASVDESRLKGLEGAALEQRVSDIFRNRMGEDVSDECVQIIAGLYGAGYTNAVPSDTPKKFTADGEEIVLNEAQRQIIDRAWTETVSDLLEELVTSKEFLATDEETQAKALTKLYDYATQLGKAEAEKSFGADDWVSEMQGDDDPVGWLVAKVVNGKGGEEGWLRIAELPLQDSMKKEMLEDVMSVTAMERLQIALDGGFTVYEYCKFLCDLKDLGLTNKEKRLPYIDSLNLTRKEKDTLYFALGYGKSELKKAPWR